MSDGRSARRRRPFTVSRGERFLDALSAGRTVAEACADAGLSPAAVHAYRRRDSDFAARWSAATALGYDLLENLLLSRMIAILGDAEDADAVLEVAPAKASAASPRAARAREGTGRREDIQLSILVLNRHRASAEGTGKSALRGRRRPSAQETDALINARLDALARKKGRAIEQ